MKDNPNRIPPTQIRILLWDIDGTLIRSKIQGSYKIYFASAMKTIFGSQGKIEEIMPSGMTDTQIIFEALRSEGFTTEQIFAQKSEILRVFKLEMTKYLKQNGDPFEVLPGVPELLTETEKNPQFINALLTGNLSVAAEIKLKIVGLWHFFENAPNVFGEISHDRCDLGFEAGKLFSEKFGLKLPPEKFIVIGDTPNDIACARACGAKMLAVATGKNFPSEQLAVFKPDFLVENLSKTKKILQILNSF